MNLRVRRASYRQFSLGSKRIRHKGDCLCKREQWSGFVHTEMELTSVGLTPTMIPGEALPRNAITQSMIYFSVYFLYIIQIPHYPL